MAKPKETLIPRLEEPASNAPPSSAAASVVGISKRFGKASVLENISFDVGQGEIVVLLGASGSGKTTILRIIAGLEMPYTGRVILHGKDVTDLPARERGTGVIFQSYALFPKMTVERNIAYGLRLRSKPRKEIRKKIDELIDLVHLDEHRTKFPSQLSGGQQQRVAIARALAYQPEVLLLDEPFGALDVKIRTQLRRSFREIQERLGITTVLVTHDQDEAFELADRVGLIDRSRMIEIGRAEDLYRRPRHLFTATFLGSGTVLVGHVEGSQARFHDVTLPVPSEARLEEGTEAYLLIRPEDVLLGAERPESAAAVLGPGTIVQEEFAAAQRRVRVRLDAQAESHPSSATSSDSDGLVLDALLPADATPPAERAWVGLRRWHFLDPPAPTLLVCDDGHGSRAALEMARDLARPLTARLAILAVTTDAKHTVALGALVKARQRQVGLGALELRVRYGNTVDQILNEQAELQSRMIVIPRRGP